MKNFTLSQSLVEDSVCSKKAQSPCLPQAGLSGDSEQGFFTHLKIELY